MEIQGSLIETLTTPLALGIVLGLALGKSIGITTFTWLAVRLGIAEMPARVSWLQLYSASWLAGIGFTMALFISTSAFEDAGLLSTAKIAILLGSIFSALVGVALLLVSTKEREGATRLRAKAQPVGV